MTDSITYFRGTAKEDRIDRETILADMDALADDAGDWKDHLPYEATIDFFSDNGIREMYEPHVNDCAYCKEMLDTLNPSDQLLGILHGVVAEEKVSNEPHQGIFWDRNWKPMLAIAATVVVATYAGFAGLRGNFNSQIRSMHTNLNEGAYKLSHSEIDFSSQAAGIFSITTALPLLDQSPLPKHRFLAARAYLNTDQTELAYKRVGEGLEFAGVDRDFTKAVSRAPVLANGELIEISAAYSELAEINRKNTADVDDLSRRIQLNAKIGRHADALRSISEYLRKTNTDDEIIFLFEGVLIHNPEIIELGLKEAAYER